MKKNEPTSLIKAIMERYGYCYEDCCNMPLTLLDFLEQEITGRYEDL